MNTAKNEAAAIAAVTTVDRWTDRAYAACDDGDWKTAARLYRRARRRVIEAFGADSLDHANVLLLGARVATERSDFGAAARTALDALHRTRRISARSAGEPVVRLRLYALETAAGALRSLGRYAEAARHARAGIRLAERRLGNGHRDLARLLNAFGMVCKYSGAFADGRRAYRRALTIARRTGDKSLERGICHNLGGIAHASGRFAEGVPWGRRSVAMSRAAFGTDHPSTAADEAALAALLHGVGKLDAAELLYKRALATFERVYGRQHYEIAINLHNLAAVEFDRGDFARAERSLLRSLALKRALFPKDNDDVALTMNNLAVCAERLGKPAEALRRYREARRVLVKLVPKAHPTLRLVEDNLAAGAASVRTTSRAGARPRSRRATGGR